MAQFRIISTLGPASESQAFVDLCVRLGQPYVRVNGSHLSDTALERVLAFLKGFPVSVTLDLQGSKRRIGQLPEPLVLRAGSSVLLVLGDTAPVGAIPMPDADLFAQIIAGDLLVLMDRQVELLVEDISANVITARVLKAAPLRARVGVHIVNKPLLLKGLPEAQVRQVALAQKYEVAALALSFVSQAAELIVLWDHCESLKYGPQLIAKLERPEAISALPSIAAVADELWLCRGDLGAMVSARELAPLQFKVLREAAEANVPCVVAGQVFHHLTSHDEPTRSEVVHLAEIQARAACGIVLSDETAIGIDPVRTLTQVAALL